MLELERYIDLWRGRVNSCLEEILPPEGNTGMQGPTGAVNADRLADAMRYSLMAGGKRIRPVLCIAAAEAVCDTTSAAFRRKTEDALLLAACSLEIVHTYSLVHDDLPAMDDDDLRRGRATCHVAFDEATAILAGDGLLTLAFEVLSSERMQRNTEPGVLLDITHRISRASGYQGMVGGQMRDMLAERVRLPIEDLERIHRKKTGALIDAAVYVGARIAGADAHQIARLGLYSRHIGLAFQVADDILNIEGDTERMGKAVGTDAERSKNTYPALLGLDKSKALAASLVDRALKAIEASDRRSDPLRAIALYIIERNR